MFPVRPLALCHQPASCLVTAIRNQLIGNSKIWWHTIQEIWTLVERWKDRRRRGAAREDPSVLEVKSRLSCEATTDRQTGRQAKRGQELVWMSMCTRWIRGGVIPCEDEMFFCYWDGVSVWALSAALVCFKFSGIQKSGTHLPRHQYSLPLQVSPETYWKWITMCWARKHPAPIFVWIWNYICNLKKGIRVNE